MNDPEGNRKLQAIVVADVAGYSRLMQDDDAATVATLETCAGFSAKRSKRLSRPSRRYGPATVVLAVFEAVTQALAAASEIRARSPDTTKNCQRRDECAFALAST
jgi:hypothetical protein